jgi:hypothetical protein
VSVIVDAEFFAELFRDHAKSRRTERPQAGDGADLALGRNQNFGEALTSDQGRGGVRDRNFFRRAAAEQHGAAGGGESFEQRAAIHGGAS